MNDALRRYYSHTPHASPMLSAPLAPLACNSLRNHGPPLLRSCWTERMSNRYTPSSMSLNIHGYAYPAPIHGPCTLLAAESDRALVLLSTGGGARSGQRAQTPALFVK